MNLKLTRLAWDDFITLEDDQNFGRRSTEMQSMDIDNHVDVLLKCGIKRGDHVVDVGGFVGDTAYVFAKYGCTVDVFEPFFDAFICLTYNTRGWPVKGWNVATGNGERIELVEEHLWNNLGMRSVRTSTNEGAMKSVRIDDCDIRPVRFMKVDCEGREVFTLRGAKETIMKYRPIMFVEMYKDGLEAAGSSPEELEETITSLGYSMEMHGEAPRWDWICRPL